MDMKGGPWLQAPVIVSFNPAEGFDTCTVCWCAAIKVNIIWSKESYDKEWGGGVSCKSLNCIKTIWGEWIYEQRPQPWPRTNHICPPLVAGAIGKTMMSLMRSRPLMCCYQLQGFGEFLSSGSRAQSSHFPDPLFLPCGEHEKTKGQWGRQFWNHCYNERKTQLHTSLGVTGNTLHSGNAQSHSCNQVSSHCHHWQHERFTKRDFKRLADTQKQSQAIIKSTHLFPAHWPH